MMNILGIDSSGLVASVALQLESIPFIIRKHIPRHCFR